MDILLSFIGNRDPYVNNEAGGGEFGPLLSYLIHSGQQQALLLYTSSDHLERGRKIEKLAAENGLPVKITFIALQLESPIDYEEIYQKMLAALEKGLHRFASSAPSYTVLLDPGTPQMQTCWFLLVKSGVLKARLVQGIPPRFAGGSYKNRIVDLESPVLPAISPAAVKEMPGHIRIPSRTAIIGESPAFAATKQKAVQLAAYDISVLITGETGTGKEVFADLIHQNSKRAAGPFVPVNCGAFTPTLLGSELFGHKKGAFTGAETERLGYFRTAEGGTIFLDEIGDLPPGQQALLLRVLENREILPIGADKAEKIDVRIIAATNRNLKELIGQGKFREDLYQRISQTVLELPSLSERREDIRLLATDFISGWNRTYDESKGLSAATWTLLERYPWPGNVRELRNAILSLCASGKSEAIGPEMLPLPVRQHSELGSAAEPDGIIIPAEGIDLKEILHGIEKSYFRKAIEQTAGNKARAAELLGLNAAAFRKAVKERHPDLE